MTEEHTRLVNATRKLLDRLTQLPYYLGHDMFQAWVDVERAMPEPEPKPDQWPTTLRELQLKLNACGVSSVSPNEQAKYCVRFMRHLCELRHSQFSEAKCLTAVDHVLIDLDRLEATWRADGVKSRLLPENEG